MGEWEGKNSLLSPPPSSKSGNGPDQVYTYTLPNIKQKSHKTAAFCPAPGHQASIQGPSTVIAGHAVFSADEVGEWGAVNRKLQS